MIEVLLLLFVFGFFIVAAVWLCVKIIRRGIRDIVYLSQNGRWVWALFMLALVWWAVA